jgi:hypothetical protein
MPDLAVIVPTRGRPENIRRLIGAWDFTNAWDSADLVLVADSDDPEIQGYRDVVELTRHPDTEECLVRLIEMAVWMPMVHKLNMVAKDVAEGWGTEAPPFALAFAGDDHVPQTIGWAARYLTVLHELGSGMVYGDDGYQGRKLSTEWAITADVVRRLGRMVPAPVEHMYCDNSMMDLFGGAGALKHLPEVRIEHMHPYAGKAKTDAQYDRVNHRDQFAKDRRAYEGWKHGDVFRTDVAAIRHLRRGRPEVTNEPIPARPRVAGSAPRRVPMRSGPSSARKPFQSAPVEDSSKPPRHFKNVRAATPEDVMMALADFATQVPADQEIVELGVFQGRTALQLAWGASLGHGAHVTAVDAWDLEGNTYGPPFTDPDSRILARTNIEGLGYSDQITLIQNFASDEAARYDGPPVGLLFVDDDHEYGGARRAVEDWAPHLAPGARIAVDDYGHPDWPGVKIAVDDLVAEGFLEPIELFHGALAVTRLSVVPLRPTEDEYDSLPVLDISAITSEGVHPAQVDSQVSTQPGLRVVVSAGELEHVSEGTMIDDLNTTQLRALAKVRGISLGARKDKRSEMLQALADGR